MGQVANLADAERRVLSSLVRASAKFPSDGIRSDLIGPARPLNRGPKRRRTRCGVPEQPHGPSAARAASPGRETASRLFSLRAAQMQQKDLARLRSAGTSGRKQQAMGVRRSWCFLGGASNASLFSRAITARPCAGMVLKAQDHSVLSPLFWRRNQLEAGPIMHPKGSLHAKYPQRIHPRRP